MNEAPSNGKVRYSDARNIPVRYQANCNIHPRGGYFNPSRVIFIMSLAVRLIILCLVSPG